MVNEKDEMLKNALEAFKRQYPTITNADLQTFIIGWNSREEWKPAPKVVQIIQNKLNYRRNHEKDEVEIFPNHNMVKNWQFSVGEEPEAILAYSMAIVAEKNSVEINDLQHLFPAVLRMLKSNINWSK